MTAHTNQRVRVSATFTADPLTESLRFWTNRLDLPTEIEMAPYHQVFQQLFDPGSALRSNRAGFNVVWIRWDDLAGGGSNGSAAGWMQQIERSAAELVDALTAAATQTPIPWLVVLGPSPRSQTAVAEDIDQCEAELAERLAAATNVHVIGHREIEGRYPVEQWHDVEGERFGHVPYTRAAYAAVGTALARRITALRAAPRKVIVLDCDNTLWRGVVGEDGVDGIGLDEPFLELQRFMVRQSEGGRLICLASKNAEADVLAVFDNRDDMVLRREHLVSWKINWISKADNIQALAAELSLGLDSFVFVDDNPVECAEVRARLPQVLTLQIPERSADIPRLLAHTWSFDQPRITEEDRRRTASYQLVAKREKLRDQSGSLSEFIDGLELRIDASRAANADVPRVSQLTLRTNQFNNTALRLTEAEVRTWMATPGRWVNAVRVSDRFGDYGLVGVALSEKLGEVLRVRGLLLSCRTLGRGVEHRILAVLGELAQREGLAAVELEFRPSSRNQPIRRFFSSLDAETRTEGATTIHRLSAEAAAATVFVPGAARDSDEATTAAAPTASWPAPDTIVSIATELTTPSAVLRAIDAAVQPRPELSVSFTPPRGQRERAIAAIWREVLRIGEIGAHDRFSDLGGASIQLVRVHGLLLDRLGIDVDITTMFQHPTVAELAAALDRTGSARLAGVAARAALAKAALTKHKTLGGLDEVKEHSRG